VFVVAMFFFVVFMGVALSPLFVDDPKDDWIFPTAFGAAYMLLAIYAAVKNEKKRENK